MIVGGGTKRKNNSLRTLFVLLCTALVLATVVRAVRGGGERDAFEFDDDEYDLDQMMEYAKQDIETKNSQ